jgi:hypothetical protein
MTHPPFNPYAGAGLGRNAPIVRKTSATGFAALDATTAWRLANLVTPIDRHDRFFLKN